MARSHGIHTLGRHTHTSAITWNGKATAAAISPVRMEIFLDNARDVHSAHVRKYEYTGYTAFLDTTNIVACTAGYTAHLQQSTAPTRHCACAEPTAYDTWQIPFDGGSLMIKVSTTTYARQNQLVCVSPRPVSGLHPHGTHCHALSPACACSPPWRTWVPPLWCCCRHCLVVPRRKRGEVRHVAALRCGGLNPAATRHHPP